ncbi:hypothetical protein FA95DRAFT_1581455 [Auriscalpium vulgare]|uniref:Uncharacterized protein n=1 Tax=Auriscalpium vulgare TaxID=40419 RepID=A0ACB8S1G8_9AGAM|nr:hypothetical protein FA95DRAFT_1581455 [Auriscalpium vulgare]
MQRATCTDIRIRSVADAQVVFFAVSKGILPIVSRRLDSEERRSIRSGSVYVWEERGPDAEATGLGIERWTDGIRWGPSRVKDEFLFYNERELDMELDVIGHPFSLHLPPGSYYGRPRERLVKQTYSVFIDTPRGRRKWHLIAYFTQETIDSLFAVDDFPALASLHVPPGRFRSARGPKNPRAQREPPPPPLPPTEPTTVTVVAVRPHPLLHPAPMPMPASESPPMHPGPSPTPSAGARFARTPDGAQVLAPLAWLETTPVPRRHPIDDRVLRSFTVS